MTIELNDGLTYCRSCSKCGTLVPAGQRCPECLKAWKTRPNRSKNKRFNPGSKAYGKRHKQIREWGLARYPVCQRCNEKASTIRHHIETVENKPDLMNNSSNSLFVCNDCHEVIHGRKKG